MNTRFDGLWRKATATTAAIALAALVGGGVLVPSIASAQTPKEKSRQNDKNLMRNLTIGLGAAAVYEGVQGKGTNALILGAGAAITGKKYEDDRKAQSRDDYRYGSYNDRDFRRDSNYRPAVWEGDRRPGSDDRRPGFDDHRFDPHFDPRFDDHRPGFDNRRNDHEWERRQLEERRQREERQRRDDAWKRLNDRRDHPDFNRDRDRRNNDHNDRNDHHDDHHDDNRHNGEIPHHG